MKFLDFVSCCGSAGRKLRPAVRPEAPEIPASAEETRSLVRSPLNRRRRKRGRLGGTSARSSAEWKPSLCSISEDNDVFEKTDRRDGDHRRHHRNRGDRTVGSDRLVKRKSATRSPRSNTSTYRDDYGRSSFPTVIPAFSPTPFMF